MKPEHQQIIAYLKKCYQSDNREQGLFDFYSKKVEHRSLITESSIFTGNYPIYPVDPAWGAMVEKTLSVYKKEKELTVSYLFLTGEVRVGNKTSKVVCPLFLIPTSLEKRDEDYYVKLAHDQASVNPSALNLLSSLNQNEVDIYSELNDWVNNGSYLFSALGSLRKLLIQAYPALEADELLMYPTLFDDKSIKRVAKQSGTHIIPAAGMGVLRKSNTTLGVLSELEFLSEIDDYSTALNSFFGQHDQPGKSTLKVPIVPAILSKAQLRAFEAVCSEPTVQITGPPGTGKSFLISAIAIDCMSKGKSVLIVSSNDQAVDVISQKINSEFQLEHVTVRGGASRDYKSSLKERLENWLNGIGVEKPDADKIKSLKAEIELLNKKLAILERKYQKKEARAILEGIFLADYRNSWWQRFWKYFFKLRMQHEKSIDNVVFTYQHLLSRKHSKVKKLLHHSFHYQLYQTLTQHRKELQHFLSALKARTSSKKEHAFDRINFDIVSNALPVWLVSIAEVSHILPLERELFDLVIIDEATQCDIASVLPVLQRAKQVVVAGDPKQLKHVSFLSGNRQHQIAETYGLPPEIVERYNYRNYSLLDIINNNLSSQKALVFLNEHFRSQPSIIKFSNQHFYEDKLRIMTAQPANERLKHIHVVRVPGSKNESGYNQSEAKFILQEINKIAQDEAHLPDTMCQTIGIVSPFRQQTLSIQKDILKTVDTSVLQRHQLLIGTPYTFQGEERDVMFISLVVDNDSHPSTFQHLAREDVFNVSITRARVQQWVVTSLNKPTGYVSASLLERYLTYIEQYQVPSLKAELPHYKDEFLETVLNHLNQYKLDEIHQQYAIAGVEIDLVIVNKGKTYCIDLVGYPGDMEQALPLGKLKILQRINITSFPLSYSRWYMDFDHTIQSLLNFLDLNAEI
ncbi:AAA domain-containing protein [Catalinimonas sp. 4WD22]|uniref:DEAD/DEAH box helicase n=1 Tax=Catalinimonas locisalis TaxID=3133978 RepID=UPI0031015A29